MFYKECFPGIHFCLYGVTEHIIFCPSLVCAMAVRNCLECQQTQLKHGAESVVRSHPAMPSTLLGTAKSATAQASIPQIFLKFCHFPMLALVIIFPFFTPHIHSNMPCAILSFVPSTSECYCISSDHIILLHALLFVTPD